MRKKKSWKRVKLVGSDALTAAQAVVGTTTSAAALLHPSERNNHHPEEEDDLYLSDMDNLQLLSEFSVQELGFLSGLNAHTLTAPSKSRGSKPSEIQSTQNGEEGSEDDQSNQDENDHGPRQLNSEWLHEQELATKVPRLPIKSITGTILPSALEPTPLPLSDDDELSENVTNELNTVKLEIAQKKALLNKKCKADPSGSSSLKTTLKSTHPKERLAEAQEHLASMALLVLEDPEKNIGMLKSLRDLASDKDHKIKQMALLTMLSVFKDIIPGYRIRASAEEANGVKLSKEVKRLREFEEGLLANYQGYLQMLEAQLQTCMKRLGPADEGLATVAMKCLCELLVSATHFNFRLNLIASVVNRLHIRGGVFPGIPVLAHDAVIEVFRRDESGEWSFDILTAITKGLKSKQIEIDASILDSFLHLRLLDELSAIADEDQNSKGGNKRKKEQKAPHVSKRVKKAVKRDDSLLQEMREAEATVSREERERNQSETLKLVFVVYFRILKTYTSHLIPNVLEGLSRFAHLINIDFFGDLLAILKHISALQYAALLQGKQGVAKSAFHCILSAFKMASGQGEALNLDLKDFYSHMYNLLFSLLYSSHSTNFALVLSGLELMFSRKFQVPLVRVAAFMKRLATLAINFTTVPEIIACLASIRMLLTRFPKLEALLDAERGGHGGTSGVFCPEAQDPELAGALSCTLWEVVLLMHHAHPMVRKYATHLAGYGKSVQESGSASTQSVAAHRPLPQELHSEGGLVGILIAFDAMIGGQEMVTSPDSSSRRRVMVPKVVIPASIASGLRKKRENGLRKLDGPAVWVESSFLQSVLSIVATNHS